MKKLRDDEVLAIVENARTDAVEFQRVRSEKRLKWLKAYRQDPYGNEVDGWSKTILSSIWDAVEGLRPNLVERFTGDFFKFKCDDPIKAEKNLKLVRYQLYQHNDFETILDQDFIYQVLNTEFGILKAYYTEEWREGRHKIPRMTLADFNAMQQDDNIIIKRATPVEEFFDGGYFTGYEDVHIVVKENHFKGFKVESVPGHRFYISSDAKDVKTARFVEHVVEKDLNYIRTMERLGVFKKGSAELVREKLTAAYERDAEVAEEIDDQKATPNEAMSDVDTTNDLTVGNAPVLICETYMHLDLYGYKCQEPVVITSANGVLLAIQENKYGRPPFFICAGFPLPFRVDGTALGEILENEQKDGTNLRRMMIDGFAQAMYRNPITDDPVLFNALIQRKPRSVINARPGTLEWVESKEPGQGIFEALEHSQNAIEEKTPYSRMSQGSTDAGNALNKTAAGMNMVLSAAARKERLLARRISRCLGDLIKFCLWVNEKIGPPSDIERILGQEDMPPDPEQRSQYISEVLLKENEYDIETVVGLGPQDKVEAAALIDQHIQFATQAGVALGITKPSHIAKAIETKHKLLGVPVQGMIEDIDNIEQAQEQNETQKAQQMEAMGQQMQLMQKQIQEIVKNLAAKEKELEQERTQGALREIEHKSEVSLLKTTHKMELQNERRSNQDRTDARSAGD